MEYVIGAGGISPFVLKFRTENGLKSWHWPRRTIVDRIIVSPLTRPGVPPCAVFVVHEMRGSAVARSVNVRVPLIGSVIMRVAVRCPIDCGVNVMLNCIVLFAANVCVPIGETT